jgi:periplasmic protein TonB
VIAVDKKSKTLITRKKNRWDGLLRSTRIGGIARKMKALASGEKISRWFLAATINVSLVLHLLIFWIFSSVQMFETHIVQDLSFENLTEPPSRVIPRPRSTSRAPVDLDDIKDIQNFKPGAGPPPPVGAMKQSAGRQLSGAAFAGMTDETAESAGAISVPSVPGVSAGNYGMHISQWNSGGIGGIAGASGISYFDMLRLKIEHFKKYPHAALQRQIEGKVIVRFAISPEGRLLSLSIARSSRHDTLDQAALKAVKDAAPFSSPPPSLLKGTLVVEIAIIFELT